MVHAKAMQLQCGGLQGLQAALTFSVPDVHAMAQQALADDKSFLDLPWQDMVSAMAAWQLRKRSTSKVVR
jgi:hypothetical protein